MKLPVLAGVLHVHSRWSDGEMGLEEIGERAKQEGLDFVVVTEHARYVLPHKLDAVLGECKRLSDEHFLMMLGLEFEWEGHHALLIGHPRMLREATPQAVVENPQGLRQQGCLVIWAHPAATYAWSLRRGIKRAYDGWEIWSGLADGPVPSLPIIRELRRQRRQGRKLLAFGGADFHKHTHRLFPVVQVQMAALNEEALLDALKKGRFATTGGHSRAVVVKSDGAVEGLRNWMQCYAAVRFSLLRGRGIGRIAQMRLLRRFQPSRSKSRF